MYSDLSQSAFNCQPAKVLDATIKFISHVGHWALADLSNQRTSEKSYVMATFNHVHNRSQWTHLMIGNEKLNKLCKKRERNKAGGGTACQYGCSQSQKANPIATICSRTFALTRTLRTSAVSYLSAQNMPACQTR